MKLIYMHDQSAKDAYLRASFSIGERLRRLIWQITWLVFCRPTPVVLHGWRACVLQWFGAKLGRNNLIYPRVKIWAPWLLNTGDVVTIANDAEIYNPGGCSLEHHTIISQGAYLCGGTHDFNRRDFPMISKPIALRPYSWICARAIVLPGVTIEEGAILGAGSVTSHDLARLTINAGNPAKVVGMRNPEILQSAISDDFNV